MLISEEGGARGTARVEVSRGGHVESVHDVSIAVCGPDGSLWSAGDPGLPTFARSAVKPLQAVPLVAAGGIERFGLAERELALCCASHGGEAWHVEAARSILRKVGLEEDALACGPHPPMYGPAAEALLRAGGEPTPIHNNCSGKHGGMLALAKLNAWPLQGYERAGHPVQQAMLEQMARWTGVAPADIATGVDGCGVVTYRLPLSALAGAFARFAAAARDGGLGADASDRSPGAAASDAGGDGSDAAAAARIVGAMVRHPEYVAGTARLSTELMRTTRGRIFAKVGAEGVYCAGIPAEGVGLALKVHDGAPRAAEPALVALLHALGWLSDEERASLVAFAEPVITNTQGRRVGAIRAIVQPERARG